MSNDNTASGGIGGATSLQHGIGVDPTPTDTKPEAKTKPDKDTKSPTSPAPGGN